jgi:hypothetical protein
MAILIPLIFLVTAGSFCQETGKNYTRTIDLKVFYFRNLRQEINDGFNVIQLVPKLSIQHSRVNIYIPVGIFQELVFETPFERSSETSIFLSPRVTADVVRKRQFDICIGAYSDIMIQGGQRASPYIGLTTGLGFCNQARNIFFRVELGIDLHSCQCNQIICNAGFTIGYRIDLRQSRTRLAAFNPNRFQASMIKAVEARKSSF